MMKHKIRVPFLLLCVSLSLSALAGCYTNFLTQSSPGGGDTPARGIITDNMYTNTYANLTFTAPEGWVYATDEEIVASMGISLELLSDAGLKLPEKLLDIKIIYDMMSGDPVTNANINVAFENLSLIIGGTKMSEKEYLETIQSQLETTDFDYVFRDIYDGKIGSDTYTILSYRSISFDAEQAYYARKNGKYMICVIVSAAAAEDIHEIMSHMANAP